MGTETVGVDSDDDLTKSKLGEYGEMQHGWTADDAKGFIKILSTPLKVYYGTHPDEKKITHSISQDRCSAVAL